jgi:hypothetical protein
MYYIFILFIYLQLHPYGSKQNTYITADGEVYSIKFVSGL